jgi:hypothetical protein
MSILATDEPLLVPTLTNLLATLPKEEGLIKPARALAVFSGHDIWFSSRT